MVLLKYCYHTCYTKILQHTLLQMEGTVSPFSLCVSVGCMRSNVLCGENTCVGLTVVRLLCFHSGSR